MFADINEKQIMYNYCNMKIYSPNNKHDISRGHYPKKETQLFSRGISSYLPNIQAINYLLPVYQNYRIIKQSQIKYT